VAGDSKGGLFRSDDTSAEAEESYTHGAARIRPVVKLVILDDSREESKDPSRQCVLIIVSIVDTLRRCFLKRGGKDDG
jgi:hypothetical protein